MAARSIGSLTVSFGLVAIPVKLYTATQSANAISFNLLHKACGSRLRQQYVCQKDGVVVERDEMVKGYEFAKDQYVRFTPRGDQGAGGSGHATRSRSPSSCRSSRSIRSTSTRPTTSRRTRVRAKPYALLTEALKQAKRCGVGHWAARGKAYLVMLRPIGDVLAMQQLHFAADVRPRERGRGAEAGGEGRRNSSSRSS